MDIQVQEITAQIKSQVGLKVEDGEELMPVLFVISGKEVNIVGFELDERVKAAWQVLFPALLQRLDATAYIMVVEAWRSIRLDKDSPLAKRLTTGEISVSQLPADDKEEVVQMLIVEKSKSAQFWHAKIERTANRRFITGWKEISEGMEMVGRMIIREW